jgi:S-adenosyl methyltransferase
MPSQLPRTNAPDSQRPPGGYASVAHSARIHDYLLGGTDNFAVDRAAAEQAMRISPDIVSAARASRAFGVRTTRHLAGQAGIRQFLDIGTGMPANNNVHQVAQSVAPAARVVCVDNDPIVSAQARALLTSAPQGATDYIEADLREPEKIVAEAARTLDFRRPVAIMLIATLDLILDREDPYDLVSRLVDAVVTGSYLVISHAASDMDIGATISMTDRLNELMAQQAVPRTHREVAAFFAGLDLLEPGLVCITDWRPASVSDSAARAQMWGAVARKP